MKVKIRKGGYYITRAGQVVGPAVPARGRAGGQNKVPRLSNDRALVDGLAQL